MIAKKAKESVLEIVFKKKEIEKMPFADPGTEKLLKDADSPLRLRIGTGVKRFYVNGRNASGKLIKRNIEHDPSAYDLDDLRAKARAILDEKDAEIELAKIGGKITLMDAIELRFSAFGIKSPDNEHGRKVATRLHYEQVLRRYADDWLDLDMRQITEQMFETRYKALKESFRIKRSKGVPVLDAAGKEIPQLDENGEPKKQKTTARILRTYISALYSFIRENKDDPAFADPTAILKRTKIKDTITRRKHDITIESATKFLNAALKFREEQPSRGRSTNQARACTNVILTNVFVGMRSGELRRTPNSMLMLSKTGSPIGFDFSAEYADLHLKTSGRYVVAFSDVLRSIVVEQYDPQKTYLFQSDVREAPLSESSLRPYMAKICELAGIKRYNLNAMRNFFINLGGRAGIGDVEMKHLVNHSTKQNVTDGYANLKNDFDYLLKNSQKVTDFIMKECGISKTEFGIEQSQTNELQHAMELFSKFDPEILKLALEMHAKKLA